MRGSEFLAANVGKSLAQWEAMAVSLAQQDSFVNWQTVPITVSNGKHTGTYFVASDYLAIGIPEDYIRLPLTPIAAQKIANAKGTLLPTSKMVDDIWRAGQKLTPQPLVPNKGANLEQYAQHSRLIDQQVDKTFPPPGLARSGQKKDVIISNIWKPGKVVIYGWYRPDGTHIQPKTNVHGDFYVDYSHGIRLVNSTMQVDGQPMNVESVLKSRELSSLLSDEGPILHTRYPAFGGTSPTNPFIALTPSMIGRLSYYQLGTQVILNLSRKAA